MQPAIIIIDMQKDFFKDEPLKTLQVLLCKKINELVEFGRNHSVPIIWITQQYKSDFSDANLRDKKIGARITIEGTEGAELLDELNFNEDEKKIIKNRYSAFFRTDFEDLLNKAKILRFAIPPE